MRLGAGTILWICWVLAVVPAWSAPRVDESFTVSIAAPAYWCPYACDVTGLHSGFTVDIARAALESEGHRVVYKNLPYDRAIIEAKSGRIDAIVPTYKGEAPGFIFPSSAVSLSEYCFYVPEGDPFRYHGLESLGNMRLVATSGYSYGAEMDAYIARNRDESVTLISGEDVPVRLRELVRRGRYDALLDDRLLFESGQNSPGLVNAGCLDERHRGYLALSPRDVDRSNAIAEAFERGIENIQEDGQLCGILEKYGLSAEFVPELKGENCTSDVQ